MSDPKATAILTLRAASAGIGIATTAVAAVRIVRKWSA